MAKNEANKQNLGKFYLAVFFKKYLFHKQKFSNFVYKPNFEHKSIIMIFLIDDKSLSGTGILPNFIINIFKIVTVRSENSKIGCDCVVNKKQRRHGGLVHAGAP